MSRSLSHAQARTFYDRFGAWQDRQQWYEEPAVDVLLAHAGFREARAVVELGCGTGRLAEKLLRTVFPPDAIYVGFDVSPGMVALATAGLRPWRARARVELTDGSPRLPLHAGSCDRFLSTYVLDLLAERDIELALSEARRLLVPGGRLCLAGLTFGETLLSRAFSHAWARVQGWRPALVGGCRPLRLAPMVEEKFRLRHREVVCAYAICSEVLVAEVA